MTQPVESLLEDLRIGPARPKSTDVISNGPVEDKLNIDKDRLSHYFLEWVRVFSTSKRPEDAFIPYITYLQKEGILSGEDVSTAFYRIAINCAVDLDASKLGEREPAFYGTDSLAKLIVLIIKHSQDLLGYTPSLQPDTSICPSDRQVVAGNIMLQFEEGCYHDVMDDAHQADLVFCPNAGEPSPPATISASLPHRCC